MGQHDEQPTEHLIRSPALARARDREIAVNIDYRRAKKKVAELRQRLCNALEQEKGAAA